MEAVRPRLSRLRLRVRVALGKPDMRSGWRPNQLANPQRKVDWTVRRTQAAVLSWGHRDRWDEVRAFVLFVGYPRSGHSLVGSLLNAHPDVVIAHEMNAVGYVKHRFTRNELFAMICRRDRVFGRLGRNWTGYSYEVPGQYQGRFRELRVVGDKFGGGTAQNLGQNPEVLEQIRARLQVPVRILHVTRNPFDNVATISLRNRTSLARAAERYTILCQWVATVHEAATAAEWLDVDYDAFVLEPRRRLQELCVFLGVDPEASFLDACSKVVWPVKNRSRDSVDWTRDDIRRVEDIIGSYPVLQHYRFDE